MTLPAVSCGGNGRKYGNRMMKVWSCTDKGPRRSQNQDACHCLVNGEEGWGLAVVCDGMGGAKSGNVASSLAVHVFSQIVSDGLGDENSPKQMGELMRVGAVSANDAVFEMSLSSTEFTGMGTTLVAAAASEKGLAVLNIGDSRAYHISESGIRQITRDHSLVEELIDRGKLSREEAGSYPGRNLITRAVGTADKVEADVYYSKWKNGDYILLCSDGLTGIVSDQEILFEILHGGDSETCCQRLVRIAVSRDAPDNVTAVLLKK